MPSINQLIYCFLFNFGKKCRLKSNFILSFIITMKILVLHSEDLQRGETQKRYLKYVFTNHSV